MKTEINESEYGLFFTLTPETPNEVSMLLRYANNNKQVPAETHFNFREQPYMDITLRKVQKDKQSNYLPKRLKK